MVEEQTTNRPKTLQEYAILDANSRLEDRKFPHEQFRARHLEQGGTFTELINLMHTKFGVHDKVKAMDKEMLTEFLKFRYRFLTEEVTEGEKAIEEKDIEGIVDSLIDLIVVAIGTLDLIDVDICRAWKEVMYANLAKEVGIKASRPNPLGLPDLVKNSDWIPPDHQNNVGILWKLLK